MAAPQILVLAAHPDLRHSRVTAALMRAASDLPHVRVHDLYAHYPDYHIDVPAEQALAASADLIVWLHPVHWYGMPPLMKLWLDDVLTLGWAYGPGGQALSGKDLWLVTSTGGPASAYTVQGYNRHAFDAFLPPYEQTAALCGMRFLRTLVLHGAHQVSEAEVQAHIDQWHLQLSSYPDCYATQAVEPCASLPVPGCDRAYGQA